MTVYVYKSDAKANATAYLDFVQKLGIAIADNRWINAHFPAQLDKFIFEEVVSTEFESPYDFGKELRAAAGCPEDDGYPYAAVFLTNGLYWVMGNNRQFAWKKSGLSNMPDFSELLRESREVEAVAA
jgi:hypothetical protein